MKQIPQTPDITRRLQAAIGGNVSPSDYAIFEATAFNTLPVRKQHPLYKGAVAAESLLFEMAAFAVQESVPLMVMHDTDGELPVGRVFYAEPVRADYGMDLRSLFFVPKSEQAIVDKIDKGTVDQVSVSMLSKQMTCSVCGFDYLGPDADIIMNVWSGVCPDGHVLGQDGVHTNLIGLEGWFEMSLVHQGGAQNARILPPEHSIFSQPAVQRLAASGLPPHALILTTSPHRETRKMDFDIGKFTTELAEAKLAASTAQAQVTTLEASAQALQTAVSERDARIAALEAERGEDAAANATALSAATTALKDIATRVLVMSGEVNPQVPDEVDALVALVNEKSDALAAGLKTGGVSRPAEQEASQKPLPRMLGAFRVKH